MDGEDSALAKKGKREWLGKAIPIASLAILFLVVNALSLLIIGPFHEAGMQAFEDPDDPANVLFYIGIILVFTLIILLIAKFGKKWMIQVIVLLAVGSTMFYAMFPLFGMLLDALYAAIISGALSMALVVLLWRYPEWYVVDICGIMVSAGAIAIFGISLGVTLVILLLVALAIYDAISVYKTKHMIDLADTVMELRLPILYVIPKSLRYSFLAERKGLKEKLRDDEERDALFMGLGDVVMPGILAAASFFAVVQSGEYALSSAVLMATSVVAGTLAGFSVLMVFVMRGKPQAGLPLLNGGAILGYLTGSLILFGKLVGMKVPFL
ncbi:MAG: hypothetical protein CVT48_03080 [Thermoplasmata archaeon HGW-Thermoplasmata-1]|nr:MAG: hypothetical protein CVT48_03080 [Thermoplasmata archaeon HGW-Thermoplasmata-1]